jgi:hypothetical protein
MMGILLTRRSFMNNHMPLKRFLGPAELWVVALALILFVSLTFDRGDAYYDCTTETTPKLCCNGIYYYNTSYVCSGRGNCIVTSTPPYCQCSSGFEGDNCEYEKVCETSSCGARCNFNGRCDDSIQTCLCYPGYGGECCKTRISDRPALKPATVAFGPVTVGSAAQSQTVTITTPGKMSLGTIALSGDNASDFSLGGACSAGGSLSYGGSCGITVAFTPQGAGSRSATLTVTATLPAASPLTQTPTAPESVTLTAALSGTGTISADSIVIDPATPTTLYAGLNGSGVYKSVNSGTTWAATAGQPGHTSIKALVIDKSDPRILYVGAYGGGVYRTADSGATWSACAALSNKNVVSLTIDANGKLYAGTEAGVFLSADGCATWAALNSGLP